MKKKTYTTEEAVEFPQDTDSYDDSSSEFTESDGSSNIYSSDTKRNFVFIEGDLPAQATVQQQQTIPQMKKSKQNKDISNFQWLPEPPII